MSKRIESRERIANAAATISVHLARESHLSDDLTEIVYHRTSLLVLQIGHGDNATITALTKSQAEELRDAIGKGLEQWTTPLDTTEL